MDNNKSFLRNIVEYSVSTWANFLLGIISVVLMTRLLAPDVYGLVSIFYSAASVTLYAMTLGMDGAYIRFFNEPPANNTRQQLLYKILLISLLVCAFFGSLITIFWGDYFSNYIFGLGGKILTGLFFLYVFCQVILRYLNISYRMSFRVWRYNFQNILINCLSKILVIVAAVYTDNFVYIIALLTIGIAVVLSVYAISQRIEYTPVDSDGNIKWSLSLKNYNEFFRFALFSAPAYIVHYLNTYANQQIIRSTLSAYALGIFSSSGLFGSILVTVRGGFSVFWTAYVYQNYGGDQKRIEKMHDYVVLFSIISVSVLIVFRDAVYLFIGQDYHASKAFFSLLLVMPVFAFISTTTTQGIAIAKKNHIDLIADIASVVVNVILSLVLIPIMELKGAAIANALSGLVLFAINTYYGQKYYKSIADYKKSAMGLLIILAILTIPAIVYDIKLIILGVVLIDVIAYLFYKNEAISVFKMIKAKIPFRKNKQT